MVKLRLGKINNEERKFIPTKMEYLEKYLNGMDCIEEYILTQTYLNGFKYREYNDGGVFKYTRNNKMSKITDVKEISSKEFYDVLKKNDYKCVRKIRKYYIDGDYEIDADYFIEPIRMVMIEDKNKREKVINYAWDSLNKKFPNWKKNPYLKEKNQKNYYMLSITPQTLKIYSKLGRIRSIRKKIQEKFI